jgi:hypothetical protein
LRLTAYIRLLSSFKHKRLPTVAAIAQIIAVYISLSRTRLLVVDTILVNTTATSA